MQKSTRGRLAAGLFVLAASCLLAPLGNIVVKAVAQEVGDESTAAIAADTASDVVNTTGGEFRVNESGSATYTIPLYVVPGTAGVSPKLSLSYSSQGGYGPLGKGWSISGLSSITRCRATHEAGDGAAADGAPRPINFTASDRYCLDGQRLVPAQSNRAACAAVSGMGVQPLATEIETFQRVCAYTPTSGTNGPAFFTVERKDGSTSWYGDRDNNTSANRADGYFETTSALNPNAALAWAQTRFQDSTGNFIDYFYYENPAGAGLGEHLLKQVNFTGKTVLPGQTGSAQAAYAKIVFNYSARASDAWGKSYASGGVLVQSRRLDSITSCANSTCDAPNQARYYQLTYAASLSGSGLDTLTSVQECRDSGKAVCLPATTFTWSQGKYEFATREYPTDLPAGSLENYESFKLADVDGDGRLDIVYLKDGSGSPCDTEYVFVYFSILDGSGNTQFSPSQGICTAVEMISGENRDKGPGDGSWQLFDYTGDGRDDLFIQGPNGAWALYASLGRNGGGVAFNAGENLISALSPAIPNLGGRNDQPQLTDFNGDGLTDLVYPRDGALRARFMERQGTRFGWGAERSVLIDNASLPPLPADCTVGSFICTRTVAGVPTSKTGFSQRVDLNGDASTDLLINVVTRMVHDCGADGLVANASAVEGEGGEEGEDWVVMPYESLEPPVSKSTPVPTDCDKYAEQDLVAMTAKSISATSIGFSYYGVAVDGTRATCKYCSQATPPALGTVQLADANGDGLSDVFYRATWDGGWNYKLNTGIGFQAGVAVPMQDFLDQVSIQDVNGDGRADILHAVNVGAYKTYNARYALPGGGYPATESSLPGGNARLCEGSACEYENKAPMFADFDGDGNIDFLALKFENNPDLYLSRATSRYTPRDTITQVTNGFGAVTQIGYAPLTNKDVYRRGSMLYSLNYGRGSPVIDLLAPIYVAAKVSSSAPQSGNPNAMATVYYRYASARVQGGGRGFLGYRQIDTFDPNHAGAHIATTTTYSQNFPYNGMPETTVKQLVKSTFQVPTCLSGPMTESCFATPGQAFPTIAGSVFSNKVQEYEADTELLSGAYTAFAPGTQAPVHVRTKGSEEILSDPYVGGQTSKVGTTFTYGAYGNVSGTVVDTYNGGTSSPMSTVTTVNSYTDTPASWLLGRLTASTVTYHRDNRPNDVVRKTSFAYDATTGLLKEERTQPGGTVDQDVRKLYTLDSYGNRTGTIVCLPTASSCDPTNLGFHQTTLTGLHRYSRTDYSASGRFPVINWEAFWNGGSGSGTTLQWVARVDARDSFGNVTEATALNGVKTRTQYGQFGRPYMVWKQTKPGDTTNGASVLTSYRWCSQVACPTGAKFREQRLTTAAPGQWTYFDALGRPIMKVVETFNAGVANKDLAVTCTTYDATGKTTATSTPFLVSGVTGGGPSVTATMCSTGRLWATTTYDALGRPTQVTTPEPYGGTSTVKTAYSGSTTTTTDARNNKTTQQRAGNGELVKVTDAKGLQTNFYYEADGSLYSVQRDAGRGIVTNGFVYDSMGRKIQQNDPDSGTTRFKYNALGELVEQIDPYGNRIENWYDGRGRVWKKVAWRKYPDGTEAIETQTDYNFDTATNGIGQLASEAITGSYTDWRTQPALDVDFKRTYAYDGMGQPLSTITTIDGADYRQETSYDDLGRPWKVLDASGRWAKTVFNQRGFVVSVCSSSANDTDQTLCPTDGNTYLTTLETDAWGHVVRERRGASAAMELSRQYYPENGRVAEICAGGATCNLVKEGYGWDAAGNLSSQQKENRYLETYTYDSLNRLTSGSLTIQDGVTVDRLMQSFEYDALGNVCRRDTAGWARRDYTYAGRAGCGLGGTMNSAFGSGSTDGTKSPHQVADLVSGADHLLQGYDARGNTGTRTGTNSANNVTIKYSLEDQAYELSNASGVVTRFWYGSDGARYKRVDGGKTTLYLGNVEIEIIGSARTYKRTVAGVMLQTSTSPAGTAANYYLFHDQLGSLVRITNASGAVVNSMDFLAFGGRRNTDTQEANAAPGSIPTLTTRGFTGHEMVDGLNITHMNGRIYDNYVGRFLQPDPVIQDPYNPQSWNAYTYVFNNPLAYTDPSGMIGMKERQWLGIIVAAVGIAFVPTNTKWWIELGYTIAVGAAAGGVSTGTWDGAAKGAFTAAVSWGIGEYFQNAKWAQAPEGSSGVFDSGLSWGGYAAKVGAHSVAGGVMSSLNGGKFGHGFVAAGVTQAFAPGISKIDNNVAEVIVAAIIGGTASELSGGKFANGAMTAAFSYAFNDLLHGWLEDAWAGTAVHNAVYEMYAAELGATRGVVGEMQWPIDGSTDLVVGNQIFEIKPESWLKDPIRYVRATAQLHKYVNGAKAPYHSGNAETLGLGGGAQRTFSVQVTGGVYTRTYNVTLFSDRDHRSGLLFYRKELVRQEVRQELQVRVPETSTNPNNALYGNPMSLPWWIYIFP